jgi:PKD repeat protein
VTFDASGSSDHWASITDYKWDFGTGTFTDDAGSNATATHTFTKAGIYTVRLKVTDDGGYSQIATEQITVGTVITQAPKLRSTTVKETSTGKAPIGVENPNAIAAKAQLTLTQKVGAHTAQIGSATATVPANSAHTISVPLSSGARSYLASHPSLVAKAKVVLSGNGTSKSSTFTVTIKKA